MSFADCLTSFAIALTTIPMPKDVIYPFQMPSYGNIATCEAQGFIFLMGNALVLYMNALLNMYYLCALRYNMQERTFRCYLEIPFCIVALVVSIVMPSIALFKDELNPDPTDPFCVPITYPFDCTKADNPECRGEGGRDMWYPFTVSVISLAFSTLMITMTLIVHSLYRNERKLRKAVKDNQLQEDDESYQDLRLAQEASGIITRQAILYIVAFLITWIFALFQFSFLDEPDDTLIALRMIFQPLQGFFNLLIFAYHKVYMVIRSDEDPRTVAEALWIVFLHPDKMKDSLLPVDNIHLVDEDVFGLGGYIPQNNAVNIGGSSDLSGFEDIILNAEDGVQFESENSSKLDSPHIGGSSDLSGFDDIILNAEDGVQFESENSSKLDSPHIGGSSDLSGFEDIILNAEDGVQFESENSSKLDSPLFVHSEGLSSIGEEKDIAYKYYASCGEKEGDGDLTMTSKKSNVEGIALPAKTIKTPSESESIKEALNSDNSMNLSHPDEQSVISGGAMLEEDSRLNYARTESAPDSRVERMTHIQQASRNIMVARGDDKSLHDWSVGRAESFVEDSSANLRYSKMKEIIDTKSRANNAVSDGNKRCWRRYSMGGSNK